MIIKRYLRGILTSTSRPQLLKRNRGPSCLLNQERYRILRPENLPDSLLLGLVDAREHRRVLLRSKAPFTRELSVFELLELPKEILLSTNLIIFLLFEKC